MNYFLAKSDPRDYTIDDLEKDGRTEWDGVRNAQAVRAIRDMRPGDKVFIYHSGGQSAIVGLAKVVSEPRADPNEPKSWVADFEFISRLEPPTTLREVKESGKFSAWALVRQSRLSTMAAPKEFVTWMKARHRRKGI